MAFSLAKKVLPLFAAVVVCCPKLTNTVYQKSTNLKEQITSTGLLSETDDETLLVSTLDGALHAITKTSGALKWTLKDDPVIINPTDSSQQSVPRFFPNPQDGSLYRYTLGRNRVPLKKLPFTIPQLVANSPCRSSDGIFYLGKKVDSWVGVDMITGEKQLVLGMDQVDRKCPKPSRNTVYFGRTLYNIILYEGTTGNKWNISFFEYATTSSQVLHDDYDLVHYTSTGEGSILTVNRDSGSVLWTLNLHSPLVAMYLLGQDGSMMTVPVEMVSPQTLDQYTKEYMRMPYQASEGSLLIKKLNPTIYIGESDGSIYAIPALVDSNTVTISRQETQLLLGGPLGAQGILKPIAGHHDKQEQQNEKNDVLLLGYYDVPENLETVLLKATPHDLYHMNDRIVPLGITQEKNKSVGTQSHEQTVSLIWDGVEQLKNLNTTFVYSGDILRWFGQITHELRITLAHEPVYIFIFIFTIGFTCIAIVLYRQAQEYARLNREWSSRRNWSRGSSSNSSKNGITATAEEQEDGNIRVGKILFDPHDLLGKGCDGTFVFRGTFDSRSVAVKRVLPGCFSIADREVDLLRTSDQHPNVIRYFCMEQCSQFRYIALELCAATLEDLMAGRVSTDISILSILQQATSGLNHLHNLEIVHRDIKPHNILLSLPNSHGGIQVMISDFGLCKRLETGRMSFSRKSGVTGTEGWIAPEMMIGSSRPTCKVDIFSLGCVFYYMLTNGNHPFGSILDRQSNIISGKFKLEDLSRDCDIVQITLIQKMLSNKPSERPPTAAVLLHPLFWSAERTLNFLQDVSDRTEKESPESAVVMSLEHGGSEVIRSDWQQHMDPVIQADLRNFRNYKGHSVRDLLRAFRNKKNHYRELNDDARRVFGRIPDEFLKYWTSRFPRLLLHTWCAMHQLKQEPIFAKYYHTDFDFIQDYQQDMANSSPAKKLPWRNQDNVRTEPTNFFDSLLKRGSQRQPKKKESKEEIPVQPRWIIRRPKNTFDPQFGNENTKDSEPQDRTDNGLSVIEDLRNEWFVNRQGTRVEPMSSSFLKSLNPLNNKKYNTASTISDHFYEEGSLDTNISNKMKKFSGSDDISENEENVSLEDITEQIPDDLSCANLQSEKNDLSNKVLSEKSDLSQEVQSEGLNYPVGDNNYLRRRDGSQLRFQSSITQIMKFVVEHISSSGARAGCLSGLRSQPDHVYETPLCLISTQGGSVPHLTQDVVHMVTSKEAILSHSAQQFCQQTKTLQAYKKGVNAFAGLSSHSSHLSIQDSSKETPQGYNDKKGISVWAYSGRQQLNANRYMEIVSAVKPDWFEALNDADTDAESSKKRIFKSMEASTNYLQQCQDLRKEQMELSSIPMFAPLLGGYNLEDRKRWSQAIAEKNYVDGYTLLGLHSNGEHVQNISGDDITELVKTAMNPLPSSSPRSAPGAWNPLTVIMLAELGIDIFDSSFPFLATERGAALVFPNTIEQDDIEHKNKKLKTEPVIDDKENISDATPYEINLKDKRLFASKDPIFSGCKCHTCQNFSRSYIHHLLNTKELLSSVLLMIHNLHHWLLFFKTLREASLNNQLDQLKSSITSSIHRDDQIM